MFRTFTCGLLFGVLLHAGGATAGDEPVFRLQMSPYAYHFDPSSDHRHVWMLGAEMQHSGIIHGITYFKNSFGQNSAYIYPWGGVYEKVLGVENLFFKWSVGVLYGYKYPYENKVPFNHNGWSPAIVPAIGWALPSGFSTQLNLLGTSGLMLQISKDL
ncbi:MAG TPA: ABC transporter ATP-binding protein [Burkholderiales bacterium]|jgi:hypothetical protein|nr:ABC transporter ATP-binding protein [Burkholderiales bacterium]